MPASSLSTVALFLVLVLGFSNAQRDGSSSATGLSGLATSNTCVGQLSAPAMTCMRNSGVDLQKIATVYNASSAAMASGADQLKMVRDVFGVVCSEKTGYKEILRCVMNKGGKECMQAMLSTAQIPPMMTPFIPGPERIVPMMEEMMDAFCEVDLDDIDLACNQGSMNQVGSCLMNKMPRDITQENMASRICEIIPPVAACADEYMTPCGCSTARLSVRVIEIMTPSTCTDLDIPTPTCGGSSLSSSLLHLGVMLLGALLTSAFLWRAL